MNRPALHFERFVLDLDSGELTENGPGVPIAALPSRLLRYLGMNRHRTVSKAELLQEVWGGTAVGESALHQALKQARHAVGDSGRQQSVIKTISGIGYRFAADVVEHLVAYAAARGILDVRGGGDPRAGAPPFWPWIEVFRQLAESRPVDELRRGAQALLDPAAVPLVGDSGEAERFRTFDIANRCLQRAATIRPMVVILEDLHEASAATLELLSFVARSVDRSPILFVGTYREPELRRDPSRARVLSQLVSLRSVTTHELTTLSEHETAYLIEQRAERRLPSALVRVLARSSAGNPLFAVELAQLLSDATGSLASESGERSEREWEQRIPRDAGRLLSDRLAALTPLARHALRAAAAIGSTFDRNLLARVDPTTDLWRSSQRHSSCDSWSKSIPCRG